MDWAVDPLRATPGHPRIDGHGRGLFRHPTSTMQQHGPRHNNQRTSHGSLRLFSSRFRPPNRRKGDSTRPAWALPPRCLWYTDRLPPVYLSAPEVSLLLPIETVLVPLLIWLVLGEQPAHAALPSRRCCGHRCTDNPFAPQPGPQSEEPQLTGVIIQNPGLQSFRDPVTCNAPRFPRE